MTELAIFLKSIGIDLHGAKKPSILQNPLTGDFHIFLKEPVEKTKKSSTAVKIINTNLYVWDKINDKMCGMNELAKFIFSNGILPLKGEEQPFIKKINLVKNGTENDESKSVIYGYEYHIFPYSERSEKNPKNQIFVVNSDDVIGQIFTEYNRNLFNAVAFKRPIPLYSTLSSY